MAWHYLRPLRGWLLAMAAGLALATLASLQLPTLLRDFVDTAKLGAAANTATLMRLALLYIAAALAAQLVNGATVWSGARVGWLATNALRADLMRHALGLDMREHQERTPGEMIERIDGDVTALANFFSQFSVRVVGALLLLVGALVLMAQADGRVGAGVALFALLTLVVMDRVRRRGVESSRQEREASARLFGFVEERLLAVEDIRALGAGRWHLARFMEVQRHFYQRSLAALRRRGAVWMTSSLMFGFGYVGLLAAAVTLYARGDITLGTVFMLLQTMAMVEEPIDQLTQQMQDLQKAAASLQRVGELRALQSQLPDGDRALPPGPLAVTLDGVRFRYDAAAAGDPSSDDAHDVLKGIDLQLAPGEVLGLLGRTGSGKTTLSRLVARLHDVSAGAVRLGGVDVRDVTRAELRRRVAVVSQDVQLFQAPVRDNVTLFDPEPTDAAVAAALRDVGLGEWLARLPDGVRTLVAAGSLSAGEAQLLAFARVLLRASDVLLLDEPSSRLDPATEAAFTQALDRLLAGRTAIVIAHRLETVARADRIVVLGDGRVLENGARAALAADASSHYAALLRAGAAAEGTGELA